MSSYKCEGGFSIPYGKDCPECGATEKDRCRRAPDWKGMYEELESCTQWQDISTAPKDGTEVLLFGIWAGEINGTEKEPVIEIGFWSGGRSDYEGDDWWACSGGDAYATWCKATHWMPLPEVPKED